MDKFFHLSLKVSIVILLVFVFTTACNKDGTGPDPEPPAIPPQSTMLMDMSVFSLNTRYPDFPVSVNGTMTTDNWSWAATNVTFWGLYVGLVNATLSIPFAAFVATINDQIKQVSGQSL